eukprot:TRINITY_DN76790_c0_g1_i1.p1 TRINITY_DN76790_c0_g1~~TRINITY_DN76790_c0_g1_i1.p1  ORF type:complete len:221 (+),score=62.47 TRINITY_DN76790_c0_g1_i1:107-769(+)
MNFVRAQTLVQEITQDGKIRDIVTEIQRTKEEKVADQKEETLRNLPEFRQARGELSAGGVEVTKKDANFEEESAKEDHIRASTRQEHDEEEYEHLQAIEDKEREKMRERVREESTAMAMFQNDQKRQRTDDGQGPDLLHSLQQKQREKAAQKLLAAPTAADRLKGRINVVSKTSPGPAAKAAATSQAVGQAAKIAGSPGDSVPSAGVGGLLGGYESDSDD